MEKYQLAKLIESAGGSIRTRKRIQKIVFLLQASGCDLDLDYRLHHYGPYSSELAAILDEMVSQSILDENMQPNAVGRQYDYSLSSIAQDSLASFESTARGSKMKEEFMSFAEVVKSLVTQDDLWTLELGSTIAYFHQRGKSWDEAVEEACKFKNVSHSDGRTEKAFAFVSNLVG